MSPVYYGQFFNLHNFCVLDTLGELDCLGPYVQSCAFLGRNSVVLKVTSGLMILGPPKTLLM